MREVIRSILWLGHTGDAHDVRNILAHEILAVIDLAENELATTMPREIVYCRFPLVDGEGNPPWLLHAAVRTVADLRTAQTPTLVCCSAGMSRSVAIAAAALASATNVSPAQSLQTVTRDGPCDLSPALSHDVLRVIVPVAGG